MKVRIAEVKEQRQVNIQARLRTELFENVTLPPVCPSRGCMNSMFQSCLWSRGDRFPMFLLSLPGLQWIDEQSLKVETHTCNVFACELNLNFPTTRKEESAQTFDFS